MNYIKSILATALVILLSTLGAQAQDTDGDLVLDMKNMKLVIKEKKVIKPSLDGTDSTVERQVKEVKLITMNNGKKEEIIFGEDGLKAGDAEYTIIRKEKTDGEEVSWEDYKVVSKDGDTISGNMSVRQVIKVIKELDGEKSEETIVIERTGDTVTETVTTTTADEYGLRDLLNLDELIEDDEDEEPPLVETEWFNMQWGFTNLINADNKVEMPAGSENLELIAGKSSNFQVHIVQQALNLYKGNVRLVYGVGVDWNNYRFEKGVALSPDSPMLSHRLTGIDYKKNKLVTRFVTAPVLLDFTFGKKDDKGVKLAMGANFGYNIGNHTKQKWEDNGRQKSKTPGDYNVEKFRIGYEVQFGYGNIVFFGKYFPNSLFKANEGPDMRSVSAGIVLGVI